jgi:regulator of PEP synthase PpsR (kinase-PPPase family)
VLHDIRTNRLSSIGVKREDKGAMEYSTMRQVTQELSLAKALYAKNPDWTVLDVTHKGVEETSARIMKIMYQSENASAYSLMKAT